MTLFTRNKHLAVLALCTLLIAGLLTVCNDRSAKEDSTKAREQQQEELQTQFQAEQTLRQDAEKSARAAELSRNTWIIGLGAGGCVGCLLAFLFGIHIGSRALPRARKERNDG